MKATITKANNSMIKYPEHWTIDQKEEGDIHVHNKYIEVALSYIKKNQKIAIAEMGNGVKVISSDKDDYLELYSNMIGVLAYQKRIGRYSL